MRKGSGAVTIRPESCDDHDAIRRLVGAAFNRNAEALLVDRIRASPNYAAEMAIVAEADDEVVGHVMISRAVLRNDNGDRQISMLSPLSVRPDRQGMGIGSTLVRAVVAIADASGEPVVVLEGSPAYYARFGFEYSVPHGIEIDLPQWAPREAAQVMLLRSFDRNDPTLRGKVIYPSAFDGLE
jgi:putative acetyltransferase